MVELALEWITYIIMVDTRHRVRKENLNIAQAIVEIEAISEASDKTQDQALLENKDGCCESKDFMDYSAYLISPFFDIVVINSFFFFRLHVFFSLMFLG